MDVIPQNLLSLLPRLPDDLLIKLYTKYLRRYRIDKDGRLIRLIDFEKYKFLEKVISRKIVSVSEVKIYEEYSGRLLPNNILRIEYKLPNSCELPDRKEQSIDDDKMYVYLNKDTGSYTIEKHRLIKNEDFFTKDKPFSIYSRRNFPRGNYHNYDWEVFTLSSDGSNQDV